ncbi:MAG: DUF3592 domain-containing protein [Planctomycetes bacterium]|nr:DUF3592 domain-containing protein [Planctomycetota bacterium]
MRNFKWPRPKIDRRPGSWKFILTWSALVVTGGIALAATSAKDLRREWEEQRWPVAKGRVESVRTMPYMGPDGELTVIRKTTYVYAARGQSFRAVESEVMPRTGWAQAARSEDMERRFQGAVSVHFNPAAPDQSWIYREPVPLDSVILGFVLFLGGIVVGALGLKVRKIEEELVAEEQGRIIAPPPDGPTRWILPAMLPAI